MTSQYDRSHKVPCILDFSEVRSQEEIDEVLASLPASLKTAPLAHVSDFTMSSLERMSTKGYPHFKNMPITMSPEDCLGLLSGAVMAKNPQGMLRTSPDSTRMKKFIETPGDAISLIESLVGQQDDRALSQIYNTANLPASILFTSKPTFLNARLSHNVIKVPKASTKKAVTERAEWLVKEIELALNKYKEEESSKLGKIKTHPLFY